MGILSGILTFGLVLSSVLLILLILVQLPKKEAGGGLAFGGGASQAVLGAGAGSALTRLTRNLTIFFLSVALLNSVLVSRIHDGKGSEAIDEALQTGGDEDVFDIDALISEGAEDGGETNETNGAAPEDLSISSPSVSEDAESEDVGADEGPEGEDADEATAEEGAQDGSADDEASSEAESTSDSDEALEGDTNSDPASPQQ